MVIELYGFNPTSYMFKLLWMQDRISKIEIRAKLSIIFNIIELGIKLMKD